MCDVLSYRSDHLVRPFLGKKWENILEQHEQIGIRIHSKSSAYRRDSCSNGFDLIPKQKEIREVLVLNFIGYNSTVMVYIFLILLFKSDKLNSYKGRAKKKYQTYIAYRVFLACEGTQDQNKKQGNKQAQHFELTLL